MGASCRSKEGEKGGKRERQTEPRSTGLHDHFRKRTKFPSFSFSPAKKTEKGGKNVRVQGRPTYKKFISEDKRRGGGCREKGKSVEGFLAPTTKRGRDDDSDSRVREKQQHKKSIIIILKNVRFRVI